MRRGGRRRTKISSRKSTKNWPFYVTEVSKKKFVSEDKVLVDLPLTSFEFVKALERQFWSFSDWRKRCGKKVNKQTFLSGKHGNKTTDCGKS
jgi:hypothetical protein